MLSEVLKIDGEPDRPYQMVLILIVVEDALRARAERRAWCRMREVLILIVVEDALRESVEQISAHRLTMS